MLAWTLYLSFLGAAATLLSRRLDSRWPHGIALITTIAGLGITLANLLRTVPGAEVVTLVRLPWIPFLGAEFHLAADGISVTMLLLTGIAAVAGVLFSWNVQDRPSEYFALYLALVGGVYGVFLSWDLLLFFAFYELAIVPKYFLIARWGSTRREYAAMKLALYSFMGSAAVLVGLIAIYGASGQTTFNLTELSRHVVPDRLQAWIFPVLFAGFAVLAGLWPFHTWAPTGHVAAPTAASMLLAGVIMKLGAYGCLRIALPLLPSGAQQWRLAFGILAGIGIVWGALVALRQQDFKFVIGYSSVSHMGFVLLGLAMATPMALGGAVLQMFSHGVIAGLLFGTVGRMIYDRTHTRDLDRLANLQLARALPFAAVTFLLASLASMGMPGFSGFVAELQVLLGTWTISWPLVIASGFGLILGVTYTLRAIQLAFLTSADSNRLTAVPSYEAITVAEKAGAILLLLSTLLLGLFPQVVLAWINPVLGGPLFEALRKGIRL